MAKQAKGKKQSRPGPRPAGAVAPEVPPELQAVLQEMKQLAAESPEGWGGIAQVFKENPELEVEVVLPFLARSLGRDAVPLLRGAALDEDATLALAALKSLPLLGTRAAGEVLAEAYAAYPEGERARLAWEGVESLRARGINVTVPEPEGARTKAVQFDLRETIESLADGVGSRATYARGQDPYGVWQTVAIVWNDRAGIKEGFQQGIGRQQWENWIRQNEAGGAVLVTVPPDYARWQVEQARRINEKTGYPLENHAERWDALLGPPPDDYQPPDPTAPIRALTPEQRAELLDGTDDLFEQPGFSNWAVEPADVRPWFEEWQALQDQENVPDEEFERKGDEILARIAAEVVTPEMREQYRERLLDASRKMEWLGEEDLRDITAAIALEMEEREGPGEVRFFRNLAENSLGMLEEMLKEGEDPEELRYDPMEPVEPE